MESSNEQLNSIFATSQQTETLPPAARQGNTSFLFEPQELPHVPRAWERVPKTSATVSRKGRIIYKRQTAENNTASEDLKDGELDRGAKRQCLNNLPAVPAQASKQRQYAPTLREQRPGTPKRKSEGPYEVFAI